MTLATILLAEGAETPVGSALRSAACRVLSSEDLARIDRYVGSGQDLHDLLPAVLPLARPAWYEATVTAQHGTVMTLGYLAIPEDEGIAVWWLSQTQGSPPRRIGPVGPTRCSTRALTRPEGLSEAAWHECRVAVGIVLRALLRYPPTTGDC